MKRTLLLTLIFALLLAGCGMMADDSAHFPGMGPGSGMYERHHAQIPADYADKQSPELTADALAKGGDTYVAMCATCHGDGGMGDGPTGLTLDPPASAVAHTSQKMSDAYLYWRIAEGGADMKTSMPAWKGALKEEDIWAVIYYMRALGSGETEPRKAFGGETYDPEIEARLHAEMLEKAIKQGVITKEEGETFTLVHDAIDQYRQDQASNLPNVGAEEMQAAILDGLVSDAVITQAQADDFLSIHQKLVDAGLMQ